MKRKTIIGLATFAVLISAFALLYMTFVPKATVGDKTITLEIVHGDETSRTVEIATSAETLGDAFAQHNDLVLGEQGPYGLFIKTVDGETASDAEKTWWCITKDGQEVATGADQVMIADGERYELTLLTY